MTAPDLWVATEPFGPGAGESSHKPVAGGEANAAVGDPRGRRPLRRSRRALAALALLLVAGLAGAWTFTHRQHDGAQVATDPPPAAMSTHPVRVRLAGSGPATRVERIAVGDSSACVITEDGWASCWGSNASGQLGSIGTDTDKPRRIASGQLTGSPLKRIAVGAAHACALDEAGQAFCWGSNSHGQLGLDPEQVPAVSEPRLVAPDGPLANRTLEFIGAAGSTTCALDDDGVMLCWGNNDSGQLGDGGTTTTDTPVRVDRSGAIAGRGLIRIGVGGDHTCAVDELHEAYCWGANDAGQLGDGSRSTALTPRRVTSAPAVPQGDYLGINLGGQSTCATTRSGEAACWGANDHGQLGIGSRSASLEPQPVSLPTKAKDIDRVAISGPTACSGSQDDRVYCWGLNDSGQLGNGTTVDQEIPGAVLDESGDPGPRLAHIATGPSTTCGADAAGVAWCWGSDRNGLLGSG